MTKNNKTKESEQSMTNCLLLLTVQEYWQSFKTYQNSEPKSNVFGNVIIVSPLPSIQ